MEIGFQDPVKERVQAGGIYSHDVQLGSGLFNRAFGAGIVQPYEENYGFDPLVGVAEHEPFHLPVVGPAPEFGGKEGEPDLHFLGFSVKTEVAGRTDGPATPLSITANAPPEASADWKNGRKTTSLSQSRFGFCSQSRGSEATW